MVLYIGQVGVLLNVKQLKEEIEHLKRLHHLQHQIKTVTRATADQDLTPDQPPRQSAEEDLYFKSEKLSLLLKWCKAVCNHYDMRIENFTTSFSDGRAFCYLLHHYHPELLPGERIHSETTMTYHPDLSHSEDEEGPLVENWTHCYSPGRGAYIWVYIYRRFRRESFVPLR